MYSTKGLLHGVFMTDNDDVVRIDERLRLSSSALIGEHYKGVDNENYNVKLEHQSSEILDSADELKEIYRKDSKAREGVRNLFKWVWAHNSQRGDSSGNNERDVRKEAIDNMNKLEGPKAKCNCFRF